MRAALSLRQNKSAACSVPMQCLEQLDIEDRLAILIYDVLAIQLWVQLASAFQTDVDYFIRTGVHECSRDVHGHDVTSFFCVDCA